MTTPFSRLIRVMIVDDHMMVRDGLKVFLSVYPDIELVAEAADGGQAFARCAEYRPDVILMDILMPDEDGPTATARIRQVFPQVQIIALTSFVEVALVQRAIQAGAVGYLLKDVHADKLAEVIREAYHGRSTLAAAAAQALVQAAARPTAAGYDLTQREREVLALLVGGKTNEQIANELVISRGTVRLHVSNILSKLGVSNRTEAATLAIQQKVV
jgi:NarL family two-component system response regulator LiaR